MTGVALLRVSLLPGPLAPRPSPRAPRPFSGWTDSTTVPYLFPMFATPDSPYPLRDLFDAAVRQYGVRLTCLRCGHVRIFHAHALWYHFHRRGWNDRFD